MSARIGVRRTWLWAMIIVFALGIVVIGGLGTYLAGEAGRLPWQEEPTRIPVTPFANLPSASTPVPEGTPT